MKRHLAGALIVGLAVALVWRLGFSGKTPARRASRMLNVLLISIDSLRADHLGCYGYQRATSPAIDALAAEGTLFADALAQSSWTLPSHAALLTSLYPPTHRVVAVDRRIAPDTVTLAVALRNAGYHTAAVTSGPFMKARYGMNAGFDHYDDSIATERLESHRAVTSPRVNARALELLDDLAHPFFLFLHYWDVHYDYMPPAPYDTMFDPEYSGSVDASNFERNDRINAMMDSRDIGHLVALYDGEIRYVDDHLEALFDELKKRRLYERTIIVLVADHGDEFFEHREKGHAHSLYNELLRVPLIFRLPGQVRGVRLTDRVELIDLFPTVLDLLGVPFLPVLQGRSLVPLMRREPWIERPVFSETTRARKPKRRGVKWIRAECVVSVQHKLIRYENGVFPDELYDLAVDPQEQRTLSSRTLQDRLGALLDHWRDASASRGSIAAAPLDVRTAEQLESLGYLDGGSGSTSDSNGTRAR